ncbi:MAG: transcription termination factor Rho [Legionellales bacterium]|nr:transcription termination factor Rho [Legionellales bacterium]
MNETHSEIININEIRQKTIDELNVLLADNGINNFHRSRKDDLAVKYIQVMAKGGREVIGGGVLEVVQDGYGFLRSADNSYTNGPADIYISPNQISRFHLKTGDTIYGKIRSPKDSERYLALNQLYRINGQSPEDTKRKTNFDYLTAEFPKKRLKLERGNGSREDITCRMLDVIAPLGKGQRALIVSPPKAGKTMLLQNMAHSITSNHPECELIVLLIDERPEEVTEMRRSVRGEVVASTFDEAPARHVQVAEMVISKAKRLVENKKDVVILLDSITRLARAYNTLTPSSGKVLTGGVDSNALQRPKRFFGAARNLTEGGSLTIIATALVDTGSKMDDIIYEEFKGTGNNEIHLNRNIAQKHIYPALNITASGTRREDLILSEEEIKKYWILRKYLQTMDETQAVEFFIERLKKCKTLTEFFDAMRKGG